MWASSQSSTARSPSAPTMRLPLRKSPWTTVRRVGWRPVRVEPAQRRARTPGAARRTLSSTLRVLRRAGRRRGKPGAASSGMRWIAARISPHCAREQRRGRRRTRRRAGCGGRWSRRRCGPSRCRASRRRRFRRRGRPRPGRGPRVAAPRSNPASRRQSHRRPLPAGPSSG